MLSVELDVSTSITPAPAETGRMVVAKLTLLRRIVSSWLRSRRVYYSKVQKRPTQISAAG